MQSYGTESRQRLTYHIEMFAVPDAGRDIQKSDDTYKSVAAFFNVKFIWGSTNNTIELNNTGYKVVGTVTFGLQLKRL